MLFFPLILKNISYWTRVGLQCCVNKGIQQTDSVIHIHIPFLFQILSHIHYYRVLSRVPCAIQYVFVDYLFYI